MSDVKPEGAGGREAVEALIAEARETGPFEHYEPVEDVHWWRNLANRLADALEAAQQRLTECEQSMVELKPDPVLVEGSWFPVDELPEILGNYMRVSDEMGRQVKDVAIRPEAAQQTPAVDREALKRVIGEGMDRYWTFDYAQSPPDEENFGEEQVVVDQLLASGILQDAAEGEREAEARGLGWAADLIEKLRALEESVPAEGVTQNAMRSQIITEFEVLRDRFRARAAAIREGRA